MGFVPDSRVMEAFRADESCGKMGREKIEMRQPCGDCPFMKKTPLIGAPDWLEDVIKYHKTNPFFQHSCHKTDPKAHGFNGAKKKVDCAGHVGIMMNDIDGTPGKGGVYKSLEQLIERYLRHWLGNEKYESIKAESFALKERGRDE